MPFIVMLALTCAVTVAGCTKTDQSSTTSAATDAPAAPVSSPARNTSPSPVLTPSPSSASVTPAPPPMPSVGFTDIEGVQGRKEIVQLAQIGVLDSTGGLFHPGDPIKRRDFVRWMFKANNAV